jgi:hypothetical protein
VHGFPGVSSFPTGVVLVRAFWTGPSLVKSMREGVRPSYEVKLMA